MKQLVKLYGVNDLGIPETHPKEILLKYDESKDNKKILENIFKKQRDDLEKKEKERFKIKDHKIINLIDLIRSFSEEEIIIIKDKLLGEEIK